MFDLSGLRTGCPLYLLGRDSLLCVNFQLQSLIDLLIESNLNLFGDLSQSNPKLETVFPVIISSYPMYWDLTYLWSTPSHTHSARTHTYTHTHTHTHTHTRIHTHAHAHTHTHRHIHIRAHKHTHTHTHTHVGLIHCTSHKKILWPWGESSAMSSSNCIATTQVAGETELCESVSTWKFSGHT